MLASFVLYYLVSRTNPKIPGTSRWRFDLDKIKDQQPGCVYSNIYTIEDLPLIKSSLRQELVSKTKKFRDSFYQFSNLANEKLEGWLDENEDIDNYNSDISEQSDKFVEEDDYFSSNEYNRTNIFKENGEDPWV